MIDYRAPGVYLEWQDRAPAITSVRTDVAGLVGIAERGPLHRPLKVESWAQYTSAFGRQIAQGYLAYAVEGFFANGGRTCWVVRVADPDQARAASLDLLSSGGRTELRLEASSPGTWGREITATITFTGVDRFTLVLHTLRGEQEAWPNLGLDPDDPRYAPKVLNPEEDTTTPSHLVRAIVPEKIGSKAQAELWLRAPSQAARLGGGRDGLSTLAPAHLTGAGAPPDTVWGLACLEAVPEVSIVAMPDLEPPGYQLPPQRPPPPLRCEDEAGEPEPPPDPEQEDEPEPPSVQEQEAGPEFVPPFSDLENEFLQRALIGHCERFKNRVAILQPRLADTNPETAIEKARAFDSSYAALYYPWLRVNDPLRLGGTLRSVPPCGHVAGIYARVETRDGVHKPPANEELEAVQDVSRQVDDGLHAWLNRQRVNVIRPFMGRGLRVAGARTLSSDPLWRYVNVRRLLIMIERSIDVQTQWLVFEPNNDDTWRDVRRVVRGFLDQLWWDGMLDGATADQAYSVVCDETSNPPADRDTGRLVCVIGVQPPWPAEYVIVRIRREENGIEILREAAG